MKRSSGASEPQAEALSASQDRAIACLQAVLEDPVCRAHMNPSTVKGFLGELLVRRLVVAAHEEVEHVGNQASVDLLLPRLGARLDVKCSTLKTELGPGFHHWGWPLSKTSPGKKRGAGPTHLVCVGLDRHLALARLYVVHLNAVDRFPSAPPRFKRVDRALVISARLGQDRSSLRADDLRLLKASERLVRDGTAMRVSANGKALIKALASGSTTPTR